MCGGPQEGKRDLEAGLVRRHPDRKSEQETSEGPLRPTALAGARENSFPNRKWGPRMSTASYEGSHNFLLETNGSLGNRAGRDRDLNLTPKSPKTTGAANV